MTNSVMNDHPKKHVARPVKYQIICTVREPCIHHPGKSHVVRVGTAGTGGFAKLWTPHEILQAKRTGKTFYTRSKTTGKTASIEAYFCSHCKRMTLRSTPDAVTDNNLDSLPSCGR